MENVKVGVYTICKNEEKFVRRWLKSMWCGGHGADKAYVLDTGSKDGTIPLFRKTVKELGIPKDWLVIQRKKYSHFRFDVARNDNLDMIPPHSCDVLVSVDLDEVPIPQFWDDLRETVKAHPDFSRISYLYAWNHNENGKDGRVFWYNKIHPQMGYRYKGAVHEWCDNVEPDKYHYGDVYSLNPNVVYLHHYPDNSKSRGSYLPLLEERIKEMPDDINAYVYLVREYLFYGMQDKAFMLSHLGYLKDSGGDLRFWFATELADIYGQRGLLSEAEYYFKMAIQADRMVRNPYIRYAQFLTYHGNPDAALVVLEDMQKDSVHQYDWKEFDYDWTWRPLHIKAAAYCWLGRYDEAEELFKAAEQLYIQTEKDRSEAESLGFYADWQWLKDYQKRGNADEPNV